MKPVTDKTLAQLNHDNRTFWDPSLNQHQNTAQDDTTTQQRLNIKSENFAQKHPQVTSRIGTGSTARNIVASTIKAARAGAPIALKKNT